MVIYFFSKDIAVSGQGGTAASEKYPGGIPFHMQGGGKAKNWESNTQCVSEKLGIQYTMCPYTLP